MKTWWTAGNQIVSSVLSNPYQFGDYLDLNDILRLRLACTTTLTICNWVVKSTLEERKKKLLAEQQIDYD